MEMKLTPRFYQDGERVFGPGVAELMKQVQIHHSLRSAALAMEMAYSKAWRIIRNAEKVASFCNDVVGDICGIVSGSTATVIVVLLQNSFGWRSIVVSTVVTALISGLTIGGKAIGKKIAMKKSKDVIYLTAKVLSVLHLVR